MVGGLAGSNNNENIDGCYATGNVTGDRYVGGLLGQDNSNTVSNCYATGNVSGDYNVGGLCGHMSSARLKECYSTGNISASSSYAGGLVGDASSTGSDWINNCFATGEVNGNGTATAVGGLVGYIDSVDLNYCYSIGLVIDGSSDTGGLVGLADGTTVISSCYYDSNTSGQSDTGKGVPLSTALMKQESTYVGWDFDTVWDIDGNYPYLQSLPSPY